MSEDTRKDFDAYDAELRMQGWIDVSGFSRIPGKFTEDGNDGWGVRLPAGIGAPGTLCRVEAHGSKKITWQDLVAIMVPADGDGRGEATWSVKFADKAKVPEPSDASRSARASKAAADASASTSGRPGRPGIKALSVRMDKAAGAVGGLTRRLRKVEDEITILKATVKRLSDAAAGQAFGEAAGAGKDTVLGEPVVKDGRIVGHEVEPPTDAPDDDLPW